MDTEQQMKETTMQEQAIHSKYCSSSTIYKESS